MSEPDIFGPGGDYEITRIEQDGYSGPAFKKVWPSLRHLYDHAAAYGDRPFLVFEGKRYSYGEFFGEVRELAHLLQERYAVSPGDRVAIIMQNNPQWLTAFAAVTGLGAIAVAVNSWGRGEELQQALNHVSPKLVFIDPRRLDRLLGEGPVKCDLIVGGTDQDQVAGYPGYHTLLKEVEDGDNWPTPCPSTDDPALIMFTSGTTGNARGALFRHGAIAQSLKNLAFSGYMVGGAIYQKMLKAGITPDPTMDFQPTALLAFPLFHVAASHAVFLMNLQIGGRIIMVPKWDVGEVLSLVEKEGITSLSGVPAMMWDVLHHPDRNNHNLDSLVALGIGGAPETPDGVARLQAAFPRTVLGTGYGMTEVGGTIATNTGDDYLNRALSAGRILPSVQIRVIDDQGHNLPTGECGEILIRSAAAFDGYWDDPEATAAMMQDGWLHSGDFGYVDKEGFIFITGRIKDMVLSGGENISCAELEHLLQEHDQIREVAAFGLPDDRLGEIPAVAIIPSPGSSLSESDVQDYVAAHLAHFKVPKQVIFTDQPFPRTALGKIIKPDLLKQLGL
ncbi:class I adenylate-forming enzyme family protein [Emcibacter nanhaiensis]|uniref:Acyl--CoA ligase n=1 Tax=Emcibacter nanhaiensis TaxID=1505037 RepID=A0A501PKY6_9PROT|nr:class I adenylate-forming enzyme family protein [Emcibacter nanhaiensis]TPD60727.1 acyl--CoA ligase [Emcibacter nanhaiensis]